MTERTASIHDYASIRATLDNIKARAHTRGECLSRKGGSYYNCWCYRAGPNGSTLPCPTQEETDGA